MKKTTKFLLGLSACLVLAGVPTGFALNLNSKNAELTQQVDDASQLIEDYRNQIDELESNKICAVSFDLKGEILDTDAVKSGECVSAIPSLPSSMANSVILNGWLLEDGASVDPLTYTVTDNITFYADYTLKYQTQLKWVYPGGTSSSSYTYIVSHTVPETRTHEKFDETWTYCGDYIVDKLYTPGEVCTFENVEDNMKVSKIIPMFSHNVIATFKVDDEIVDTQEFVLYNTTQGDYRSFTYIDTTSLETPTKDGYTFKGWAVESAENTIINFSIYQFTKDTTFVAVFK